MKSCRPLKCQAWLITHARSLKNLTGQIFPPKSPSCRFRLALWKNGTLSLLVSDITYLGLDRMIPNGLHTCSRRSRGLEPERDTWRGTPHNLPFPSFFSIFLSFPFILFYFSFSFLSLHPNPLHCSTCRLIIDRSSMTPHYYYYYYFLTLILIIIVCESWVGDLIWNFGSFFIVELIWNLG